MSSPTPQHRAALWAIRQRLGSWETVAERLPPLSPTRARRLAEGEGRPASMRVRKLIIATAGVLGYEPDCALNVLRSGIHD